MPFHRAIPETKQRDKSGSGLGSGFGAYVQAEKLVQIALVLPCAVLIGWGGGAWLDMHFHHAWLTLAGIALGSVAGMMSAIRMAMDAVAGSDVENKSGQETKKGISGKES
jgi:ATP synthase protein I